MDKRVLKVWQLREGKDWVRREWEDKRKKVEENGIEKKKNKRGKKKRKKRRKKKEREEGREGINK